MRRKFDVKAYEAEMQRTASRRDSELYMSVSGSVKGSDGTQRLVGGFGAASEVVSPAKVTSLMRKYGTNNKTLTSSAAKHNYNTKASPAKRPGPRRDNSV